MKATKLILAIVFCTFSTLTFSQSLISDQDDPLPSLSVEISLSEASQIPTLVHFMKIYINPSFLEGPNYQRIYTIEVRTTRVVFFVTGTLSEWKNFFNWHQSIVHQK